MVPAADVAWLDASAPARTALDQAVAGPHTRYPVAEGTIDRLVGVIHLRELVEAVREDPAAPIGPRAQPALVVPTTKDLGALLRDLREGRRHLAVVADEYGGSAGIVTLEDVLEEIVGEIEDEYDLPDDRLTWVDDERVAVAGSMTVDDFNETVGTRLPVDRARTMAGLVFSELGRRPHPGDEVALGGVRLEVEHLAGVRITRLTVELPDARR